MEFARLSDAKNARKVGVMDKDDLSPELREKARACKTTEELLTLAETEGVELSDDQLEAVSGGAMWDDCETFLDCNGDFD